MSKITSKIALPIILTGIFATTVFVALNYENLGLSFYLVFSLLAICIFFFGFSVGQSLSSPIKELLKKANDLSQGDLSSRVYLKTKDELSELAKTFNQIAENLEQSYNKGENAEKSIETRVKAKTQAMEETISALEQKVRNRTEELGRTINELERVKKEALKKNVSVLRPEIKKRKAKKA